MKYNPEKHHRCSIRLKGYDYSLEGLYFITICIQNHKCLFGKIVEDKMILNDAGKMIEKWYHELGNKFINMKCRKYIVMPNHFHCIIETSDNYEEDAHIGTSLRGRPLKISLFDIMDWFKTMTTNEYIRGAKNINWQRFEKHLWQLRYWDHIIRNENDNIRIENYIINNPSKWNEDKFNK